VERLRIVQAAKRSLKKPEGKKALDYLMDKRGFSLSVIEKFNLGYCPESVEHQLRGRIITPIYDIYGELVALSTRYLDEKKENKFWHETFDKGSYLYGLCYAKEEILKHKKAIIVEGEFDVAALHTNGFNIAVGVCGSAFTLLQASLLSRYCSEVYILFDGDTPGKKAIERTMNIYGKFGLDVYGIRYIPVYLPKDTDPDEYVINCGKEMMKELLIKAKEENKLWNKL
jgi:DNA primase